MADREYIEFKSLLISSDESILLKIIKPNFFKDSTQSIFSRRTTSSVKDQRNSSTKNEELNEGLSFEILDT